MTLGSSLPALHPGCCCKKLLLSKETVNKLLSKGFLPPLCDDSGLAPPFLRRAVR